ncbi:MAG: 3-deoxy-7-phosphoheptulonate synthase class II [Alkalispirochaeta sp.]
MDTSPQPTGHRAGNHAAERPASPVPPAPPAAHQISYDDPAALDRVLTRLRDLPPLVFPGEVDDLTRSLTAAAEGRAFVLHGGDCVERFADCRPGRIADRLKILLQMSVVLTYAARTPVVRIGRMAGQYFKPRSAETEILDGREVMTYRGDPVHRFELEGDPRARTPDPDRLLQGYFTAAATLNYIRAMIAGGFADLHHPHAWDLDTMRTTSRWEEYRTMVDRILDAIHFMESFGGVDEQTVGNIRFFTSHEALHLPWEQALTRAAETGAVGSAGGAAGAGGAGGAAGAAPRYNLAAHTVWLGARTSDPEGSHVAYLREIVNPIGIKVSSSTTPEQLTRLLRALDSHRTPGRITLITRMGRSHTAERLPRLIRTVRTEGHPVIWSVDPMHGNTETTASGRKTRRFEAVLDELKTTFSVHRAESSRVQGVHFELTGDDVTECTGGSVPLSEADLERNYESWCDPRLNYTQSMEMAFLLAQLIEEQNR